MINRILYRFTLAFIGLPLGTLILHGQDSSQWLTFHFQQTVVTQGHTGFMANYSGPRSLRTDGESQTSLTATMYLAGRLGKNTFLVANPEMAGGGGMSGATGVAGFPNGETFRIGNPTPQVYMARLFIEHYIRLSKEKSWRSDGVNTLAGQYATSYLHLVAGRFGISDYFDNNSVSHDPRSQFLNWSLMGNGAYDYAANTRGYTWGVVAEWVTPSFSLRAGAAMVPTVANLSTMDGNLKYANALQLEIEKPWSSGTVRFLMFTNSAHMGNYNESIQSASSGIPDISSVRTYGHTKSGFGINVEQQITEEIKAFGRLSWNDGKNETWMFTEIDQSISGGISGNGIKWKRPNDVWGVAGVVNGISTDHQQYLAAGGNGFMIGDGNLSYANEMIGEIFYKIDMHDQHFYITPDYQFVMNPAYNKDRGPVNVIAIRVQTKF